MSEHRILFVAAYDISCPRRLRRALHILKGYACGRQKSVFEVWLTADEKRRLLEQVAGVVDAEEDRFFLLQLTGHKLIHTLGIAVRPMPTDYFYIG